MITNTKTRLVSAMWGISLMAAAAAESGRRDAPDARGTARAARGGGT